MARRRIKYGVLTREDHRLDMSPVGRNIFVSRDKQEQHQAARRIKLWMKVVLALVITAVCVAGGLFAFFYLAPWFQSELVLNTPASASGLEEDPLATETEYDDMGLPIYSEEVCLFVVNTRRPAGKDFSPVLTEIGGRQVDSRIAPALRLLIAAAKEEGLALVLTEGYVSYDEQEKRFEAKAEELQKALGYTTVMARARAATVEPQAGESDFQSGMCVRIDGDPETFGESRTYSWLKSNMGKYGFIFRYPEDKEEYTGIKGDPTVLRYVGSSAATAMQQRSMCLEEYIDYLRRQ